MELAHEVLDLFRERMEQARCPLELRAELNLRVWWDRARMGGRRGLPGTRR
ncbi:hypothetical protein [Corallococcus sp. RDP092CA]|uniref:hypothetical protein n=1 Tax=Corallococcus sp. RDP092CA TaxID=3109369 RepID=UPI0035B4A82B